MIQNLLRHIIFETCISVFFEKLMINFSGVDVNKDILEGRLGTRVFNIDRKKGGRLELSSWQKLTDNKWYHMAMDNNMKVYINGKEQ